MNNSAQTVWLGTRPFNASSVTLTENWDIDFVAVSWTFSGAPSGTVNHGSGRISWSRTATNNYKVDHAWNELRLSVQSGTIHNTRFDVSGEFQFGSNFFRSVSAFSSGQIIISAGIPLPWNGC
jgi:hypothetical protein